MNGPSRHVVIGIDLGQSQDHTGIVVIRTTGVDPRTGRAIWTAEHVERVALGTSYVRIAEHIAGLRTALTEALGVEPSIVADATGVGAGVIELLRGAVPFVFALTITAGHKATNGWSNPHVPKSDLVAQVTMALEQRRLNIAPGPYTEALAGELLAFRAKPTLAGGISTEAWRERDHDDLTLALAMSLWIGSRATDHPSRIYSPTELASEHRSAGATQLAHRRIERPGVVSGVARGVLGRELVFTPDGVIYR